VFDADRPGDVRTVVNGVAGPEVERVTITLADQRPRTVPHSAEGAFALALRGYPEDHQPLIRVRRRDGATREYPFAGANSTSVPDPEGGRAWRVITIGPYNRRAPDPTHCATFLPARPAPNVAPPSSTPVCGVDGGARHKLYFDTRRLSGDGPSDVIDDGDWNHHPPRTAVWGMARGYSRVVVRAGGFEKSVKPFGAFLVFLPAGTDPKTVTVEVDGRRYGSSYGTVER
jgi:hypothetical protein